MKMNKKGFTLVELLAVIAILAILILLVTPNILSMFNEGKESVFVQQGQRILDASNTKYVNLSLKKSGSYVFTNLDELKDVTATTETTPATVSNLNLTSNSVKYCVKVSSTGKVTYLHISDDNYSIKLENANGISLDDINKMTGDKYDNLKVNGDDTDYSAVKVVEATKTCE